MSAISLTLGPCDVQSPHAETAFSGSMRFVLSWSEDTASNLRTHSMLAFDTLWVCDVVQESSLLCCDDKKVIVVFVVFVVLVIFVVLVLSSSLSQWFPGHVLIHAHWCPLRGIACHRCINVNHHHRHQHHHQHHHHHLHHHYHLHHLSNILGCPHTHALPTRYPRADHALTTR